MVMPEAKPELMGSQKDIERAFAVECLRQRLQDEKFSQQIPEDIDWKRLYQFLKQNRLAAHFSTFPIFSSQQVPSEFRHNLRESRYGLLIYGDTCIKQVQAILNSFKKVGIPVIVLKGWTYIYTIYGGDYGQRYYEDIDLLVLLKDRERARHVLLQLNYIPAAESWPGYTFRFNGVQAYFSHKKSQLDRSFVIGLHWGLINSPAYDPYRINIEALFSQAVPIKVVDVDTLQLSLEDQLIYACAHLGFHHGYDRALYRYYEIAALIGQNKCSIDWNIVCSRAVEWKCVLPLQNTLLQIDIFWPGIIAKEVLTEVKELHSSREELINHRWMLQVGNNYAFKTLLSWFSLPRGRGRFLMAFQDIFPCKGYMCQRYGVVKPAWLWPILYLKRFAHSWRFAMKIH
jgi:hypothetical protein